MTKQLEGIALGENTHWVVTSVRDASLFFANLSVILPKDSVLYFEGTAIVPDISKFLKVHPAPAVSKVMGGTIWPQPEIFHTPFSPEISNRLIELAVSHASVEICDHFHAYKDGSMLLQWFDAWTDDPIGLSREITEAAVAAFCKATGSTFELFRKGKR
jgi:hypothetical protein